MISDVPLGTTTTPATLLSRGIEFLLAGLGLFGLLIAFGSRKRAYPMPALRGTAFLEKMTAAAKAFSCVRYVDLTLAADAEAKLPIGGLAQEGGGLGAVDGDEVVDDTLAVLGVGPGDGEVLACDPGPGEGVAVLQVGEGGGDLFPSQGCRRRSLAME